jgi:hypothetical protein
MILAPMADEVEYRKPIVIDGDSLTIDYAGARGQCGDGGRREREARRKIVAVAGNEAHACSVAPRYDAEAVVLDLMNPSRSSGRLFGRAGQARLAG